MDRVKGFCIVEGNIAQGQRARETEPSCLMPWERKRREVYGHPEPQESGYHSGGTPKQLAWSQRKQKNYSKFPASAKISVLHTCP